MSRADSLEDAPVDCMVIQAMRPTPKPAHLACGATFPPANYAVSARSEPLILGAARIESESSISPRVDRWRHRR